MINNELKLYTTEEICNDNLQNLCEEDYKRVKCIVKEINIKNPQYMSQFGNSLQNKVSGFTDSVLNNIKIKDSGHAGEILGKLDLSMKELKVEDLNYDRKSVLKFIPIINLLINNSKKFFRRYEKIRMQIENIVEELEKVKIELLKEDMVLEKLYEKNLEFFKELEIYIIAGSLKLEELKNEISVELNTDFGQSTNAFRAQSVSDMENMVNRFERRVHDLKLSKNICIQTAPQIRFIQNSNKILIDKLQSCILNTIPLWKSQMIMAIGLCKQENILKMQVNITETTNQLLIKNSEVLKDNSLSIAKEGEKGIVELEVLKKINSDLINVIEETIKIQQEGSKKRKFVEQELNDIESKMKSKLLELRSR